MRLRYFGLGLAIALASGPALARDASVTAYHNGPEHAGLFTVPGLTAQTVAKTTSDTSFAGSVTGLLNAAPLYWQPKAAIIVASDSNEVAALDERTGRPLWRTRLAPASGHDGTCGNISPVGVTGTPVIDRATGTLYADAVVGSQGGEQHSVYAVSLATGAVLPGWPIALGAGVRAHHHSFDDRIQEQRGALALVGGTVFIPFGGYDGDCGPYHGMVVGVSATSRKVIGAWATREQKGGIWGPGGMVSDGKSLFVATGNTADAASWGGGEAVIHLALSLAAVTGPADYFSPANWRKLDSDDLDLGGVSPTLIDLPGAKPLLLALGKDGDAYLLGRDALGGIGQALQTAHVAPLPIRSATASYRIGDDAMVVVNASCAGSAQGMLALRIKSTPKPHLTTAWCTALDGAGAPIVTTSDGTSDPIFWATGAEGDERLHAYDGATSKVEKCGMVAAIGALA
jgi:hypothetical protein